MFRRSSSHQFYSAARKLILPAAALGILAVALGRRSRAPAPMPRLPVRRKPKAPNSSRLRRLGSTAPAELAPPEMFWDAAAEEDDPAEIPAPSSPLVSQASQSAAGVSPGAFHDATVPLRW